VDEPGRTIAFDAVFNFRDLGGYPARDGRRVRWRRLFRADGLHRLRPEESDRFRELGITTVIDLRSAEEVATRGRVPEPDVVYHHLAMFDVEPDWPPDDDSPGYLADRYLEMVEEGRRTLAASLEVLSDEAAYPLVFHCAAGKDRTGILAAVVLALLGVPDDVIVQDYALSQEAMGRLGAWLRANMPDVADANSTLPSSVFGATVETMTVFLAHLQRAYGGAEGLVRELGVDPDLVRRLREHLLISQA
jgi:protein tyrosine/serine phosphatase